MRNLVWAVVAVFSGACGAQQELTNSNGATLATVTVTPGTATMKRGFEAQKAFTATGTFSDMTTEDLTHMVSWSSEDSTIATVDTRGIVSCQTIGTVTINASIDGIAGQATVTIANPLMAVVQGTTPEIEIFDAFASGETAPLRVIKGDKTTLVQPWSVQIVGDEIFVADNNSTSSAIDVFSLTSDGNVPPLRQIKGANTKLALSKTWQLRVSDSEIYVASDAQVLVFPISAIDNIAPTRILNVPDNGQASRVVTSIAVYQKELYVMNNPCAIDVFPSDASGTVAPQRTIKGDLTQLRCDPYGSFRIAVSNDTIFEAALPSTAAHIFATQDDGNVPPRRQVTGAAVDTPLGMQVVGTDLFLMNWGDPKGLHVYSDAATVNGDAIPARTMTSATLVNPVDISIQ